MIKIKSKMHSFILIFIPFLLFFIFIEVTLRFSYFLKEERKKFKEKTSIKICPAYEKQGINERTYYQMAESEYSTYLGYIPKANYEGHGYMTNNMHFRYSEVLSFQKQNNEFRVFVTGGSVVWGTGVSQEDTLCNIAEQYLRKDFPDKIIRVISAGVGAYSTTQERIFVENWILNFSPDVVIMFSGWNDVYYGFCGTNILVEQDFLHFRDKIEGNNKKEVSKPNFEKYFLKTHYYLLKAIYKIFLSRRGEEERKKIIKNQRPIDDVVNDLLRNVHIVADLSKRYNFKLVFILQPALFSTKKVLTDYERNLFNQYTDEGIVNYPDYNNKGYVKLRKILSQDAKENGYAFYDADEFISSTKESIFIDFCHFGDRGNKIFGEGLYKIIKNFKK